MPLTLTNLRRPTDIDRKPDSTISVIGSFRIVVQTISGLALVAGLTVGLAGSAAAQIGAPPTGNTAQIIDELQDLIDLGEQSRAASPSYLNSLRDLVRRYNWPWQSTVFTDNFSDGDYTRNPAWNLLRGSAFVARNQGLVLRASNTVIDTGGGTAPNDRQIILSATDRWTGAVDRFAFQPDGTINNVAGSGETIDIGPARIVIGGGNASASAGIRSVDAYDGNFSFIVGSGLAGSVRVGLYAASNDVLFRARGDGRGSSLTSGLSAMPSSWWIDQGGRIMQSGIQVASTNIGPTDRVVMRRRGNTIEVIVNSQVVHSYSRGTTAALRTIISFSGNDNFFLENVRWRFRDQGPAGPIGGGGGFAPSTGNDWAGAVGNFSFDGDSVVGLTERRSIVTSVTFDRDFVFRATVGRNTNTSNLRLGLYDANEDARFDAGDPSGDLNDMTNSWWIAGETIRFGGTTVRQGVNFGPGTVIELRRDNGRISFRVNGNNLHVFDQASSGPLRVMVGRSAVSGPPAEIVDVGWNTGADSGDVVVQGGSERVIDAPVDMETPVFITNAFAIETTIAATSQGPNQFDIGVVRQRNRTGYRVSVSRDRFQSVELVRINRNGEIVLGRADRIGNLSDGRQHRLLVTRDADGQMTVSVDDQALISANDNAPGTPFSGLTMGASVGEFLVTSVTAFGI